MWVVRLDEQLSGIMMRPGIKESDLNGSAAGNRLGGRALLISSAPMEAVSVCPLIGGLDSAGVLS